MHEYRYYIKKIERKDDDTVVLELGDIRGIPVFDFQPGQYVMIYYKDKKGHVSQKHTFSIASSPIENGTIRLGIRVSGLFTAGLLDMQEGDEIFVSGPYGNFTFKKEKHLDLVFIAGGVGITPFISTLRYATTHQLPNKMTLLYSNRTLASTLFLDEILELEKKNENLHTLFSITDERLPYEMASVINQRLSADIMKSFIGNTYGKTFFICGPEKFMEAMKENLKSVGVHDFQIETEGFSMIADAGVWQKFKNTAYAFGLATAIFLLPFYFIQRSSKNLATTESSATADLSPVSSAPAVDSSYTIPIESPTTTPTVVPTESAPAPATVTTPPVVSPVTAPAVSTKTTQPASTPAPAPKPKTKVS